jgi:hypothetical protein
MPHARFEKSAQHPSSFDDARRCWVAADGCAISQVMLCNAFAEIYFVVDSSSTFRCSRVENIFGLHFTEVKV